ncbi:MAG: KH domain-containing protein [Candidatus Woesearchaeota archaeon]
MEFSYDLKIPKDRVAVLIGKKGEVKAHLESITKSHINVDSKEGDVRIEGNDSLQLFTLRDVIIAIGRGFNPDTAQLLLKADYALEMINLLDWVKDTKGHFERVKGRVIGADGKARRHIEHAAEVFISVYGKTISIIGRAANVSLAKRAVENLLAGSPHSNTYRWLEKQARELRLQEF